MQFIFNSKSFKASLIALSSFIFFTACSNSGNKNETPTPNATPTGPVSPQSIQESDFQDIAGKIYGKWSLKFANTGSDGSLLSTQFKFYVRADRVSIILSCSQKGKVIQNAAGTVLIAASNKNITFKQSLTIGEGECSFTLPQNTFAYDLYSTSGTDELDMTTSNGLLSLYRNTPSQPAPQVSAH